MLTGGATSSTNPAELYPNEIQQELHEEVTGCNTSHSKPTIPPLSIGVTTRKKALQLRSQEEEELEQEILTKKEENIKRM